MAFIKVRIDYTLSGSIEVEVEEEKLVAFERDDGCPLTEDDAEEALGITLDSHAMVDGIHATEINDIERVKLVRAKKKARRQKRRA